MMDKPQTYEELREKFSVEKAQLRARCHHLEAGLKVIADGQFPLHKPEEEPAAMVGAIEAFAQSTLDEAPEAK